MRLSIILGLTLAPNLVLAQDATSLVDPAQTGYIFTSFLFLVAAILVFWMHAGFAMLEAGLVRSKNVTMQLTKNVGLFAVSSITYFLVGYLLMYPGEWMVDGLLGQIGAAAIEPAGLKGAQTDLSYASTGSDFLFQLMFCGATASIVSGALAERIKLWPFLAFAAVLTGVIYPIEASWQWGGGFLSDRGFHDFAGATLVHSAGGWAALAGVIVLGARKGKYKNGRVIPIQGSNLALAALGTFILWMGWFGFNGGSQLSMDSAADVADISRVMVNTHMAAAMGALVAIALTAALYRGKVDLTMALNGALGGLVAITADPLSPGLPAACFVGGVGAAIVVFAVPLLDRWQLDDVVGAIPVHLCAGIWGTLAVPLFNDAASFGAQLTGALAVGLFTFPVSYVVWTALHRTVGIRVDEEAEVIGLDVAELGMEAYPEFHKA